MKKIKLLTYFLFSLMLLFSLTACKKGLSAPTITSDGLTVSWNKIEGAEQYLIYDTNNTFIAETTDLSYTFSDIFEDINIYVKSSIKKKDEYKISARSNVVTISTPVLDSPFLTASKYTVQWSTIKYADHYKIFNAENDIELAKTKDLSYQFNTDAYDLKVYVIAYYENKLLEHKKSNKSNTVSINPTYNFDSSIIDVSKTNGSDFVISNDVTSICFTGKAESSWNISVQKRTTKLDITFDNLNISSSNGSVLTALNNDYELNLHVKGNCIVSSANATTIIVNKINIDGDFHATLLILAGNGQNGSDGIHGSMGASEGGKAGNGTDGADGKPGYDALHAKLINVSDVQLTCTGGNGGNGGRGGNGGIGGTGKTLVNILSGGKDGNKNFGGNGGNGGNGGDGGTPGIGVSEDCAVHNDGTAVVSITNGSYGAGGNGGHGGNGGSGGNYYNSLGSVWQCAGGSGGNGGNGGNGSRPGSKGLGGSIGSQGTGTSVNGIGLGINYGQVYYDGGNNPATGSNGVDGGYL